MSVMLHWMSFYLPSMIEKREIMTNLLENVQTSRLKNAFEKYLPAVISETKGIKKASNLTEQTR